MEIRRGQNTADDPIVSTIFQKLRVAREWSHELPWYCYMRYEVHWFHLASQVTQSRPGRVQKKLLQNQGKGKKKHTCWWEYTSSGGTCWKALCVRSRMNEGISITYTFSVHLTNKCEETCLRVFRWRLWVINICWQKLNLLFCQRCQNVAAWKENGANIIFDFWGCVMQDRTCSEKETTTF